MSTRSPRAEPKKRGDGQLGLMLVMGCAVVYATMLLADISYPDIPNVGVSLFEKFVKTSILGTGIDGDLFIISFSYIPLMWLAIFLRNKGIGSSILKLKTLYNIIMTLFSLYCFVVMGIWRFRPKFEGEMHGNCETAIGHVNEAGAFQFTAELFFWSKYIEWLDSIFLLYKGKPISVLHGFHHLGAPIAMGSMVAAKSEFVWIFVFWNSFVHTIMYFYYFATGVGLKWARIFRPFITSGQIIQFCTGLPYLWVRYRDVVGPSGACGVGHPGRTFSFLFQFPYVTSVLVLFMNFYVKEYILKPTDSKTDSTKKPKAKSQ